LIREEFGIFIQFSPISFSFKVVKALEENECFVTTKNNYSLVEFATSAHLGTYSCYGHCSCKGQWDCFSFDSLVKTSIMYFFLCGCLHGIYYHVDFVDFVDFIDFIDFEILILIN